MKTKSNQQIKSNTEKMLSAKLVGKGKTSEKSKISERHKPVEKCQGSPIAREEGVKIGMKPTKLSFPQELEVVTQSPDINSQNKGTETPAVNDRTLIDECQKTNSRHSESRCIAEAKSNLIGVDRSSDIISDETMGSHGDKQMDKYMDRLIKYGNFGSKEHKQGRKDAIEERFKMFQPTKEFCNNCRDKIKEDAIKEVIKLIDKVRIRTTISYPTMLQHSYISSRDFIDLKNNIKKELTNGN